MISKTNPSFWDYYRKLPVEIQRLASVKYRLWEKDPFHPSMHFKVLNQDVWSVRINLDYRAMGRRRGELIVWFWIGTHEQYNRLVG